MRGPFVQVLLLASLAMPVQPAGAAPPQRMTFKNNLLPGYLTRHQIVRVTQRTSPRKDYTEKLRYRQQADWLQCNIPSPRSGETILYQMMVDQPAEVLSVSHGKKKIQPTPPAAEFNLPVGSTRLHSVGKTYSDAPVQVPMTDPVEKIVLALLLDVAHWPSGRLEAGRRWEDPVVSGDFSGTQTFEFVDLGKVGDGVAARVTLFVQGDFVGPLARDYSFEKAQAIFYWSRLNQTLVGMEAQAFYSRRRAFGPETYKLRLDVHLTEQRTLDADEQERVKVQLNRFAGALDAVRAGDRTAARDVCQAFRKTWPTSIWLPAVDDLERQTVIEHESGKRYSLKELQEALARTIVTYEAAKSTGEYDLLEKTRQALAQIAREYGSKLGKLAGSKDDAVRASAVFASAFGARSRDLDRVQRALSDRSSRVRAMALYGLAARGDSTTPDGAASRSGTARRGGPGAPGAGGAVVDVERLIAALDDKEAAVRLRACQAVAACVPPDHYSIVSVVEKIDHLMIFDDSAGVRLEAVRALAAIGAPADVARLEKALTHELDPVNREAIHGAIERLQGKAR